MWKPFSGAQEEFCSRGEFEVLYGGQAGPGKTSCLISLATRQVRHSKYSGLIIRRTFPQLQEIIDRCHELYPKIGGVFKATEHRWYFPSGAKITLGHMQHENDKYNYQGKEFQFCGFDELTQFTETQYLYLFSRVRSSIPGLEAEVRSTTNPGGAGHTWVKKRFIDICRPLQTYVDPKSGLSRCFVPGKIEDNPALLENDPDYLARLDALPEIERLRLKHGIWDAFEGQVFTELNQSIHGVEPFEIPPDWYKFMAFDWGFAKPFSVGWYAVDFDGVLYRYREWYGCKPDTADQGLRMSNQEIARGIFERENEKINARIADPAIWSKTPSKVKGGIQGPSVQEDMAREGIFFLKADNDRIQGKQQVHKRFEMETEIDPLTGEIVHETPRFYCFNNCHHFWRTLPLMREAHENPEDVEDEEGAEDHVYDECRYAFMFRPIKPKKIDKIPEGSVAAERRRLKRAREYSKAHGVSLHTAYGRVR